MLSLTRTLLCPVLFVSLFAPAPAQTPPPASHPAGTQDALAALAALAAESFIVERQDSVFSYKADGTGYRESTLAITVQSEAALHNFGVVSFSFASNSEKVELHYVRVRRHDGTVVDTPLTDAVEQPEEVTREAPFYSDLKQLQIPVKSLGVGDTLEWQARIVRTQAEAPGEFWGQETFIEPGTAPVREESFELHVPRSKAVTVWTNPAYLAATNPARHGAPTDKTVGDERILRWESADLRPTTGKEADAAKEAKKKQLLTPAEELDAEQGKLPTVAWTTFPSWAAVGAWYRGLEGDRMQPDAEIKARVAELTAGKLTDEDKVRAVYAYTSAHIRYIGVAFGVGRYQPHRAEDVLGNQYGDCKDKETLLASMLLALGLHPDAALIGAGLRFNPDVPSPGAFNHLILRVQVDGQPVWLDPTTEVAPYRMLLLPLRDKPALVIPETGAATVEHTPADMPFPAREEWTAVGKLDATGTSESHIVATYRGDDELVVRAIVRQVPPASYDELGQRIVASLGYAGKVSHVEFSRPDDTAEPERFSFDYHREKSGDWDNLRIVPQVAPVTLPTVDDKEPPVAALDLQAPRVEHSRAELTLPEGWSAELPEAVHQKTPWATYDMTYRLENSKDGHTIVTERTVAVLQRKVPAADWKAWKTFQDASDLGMENYIQLRHVTVPAKPRSAAPGYKAASPNETSAKPVSPGATSSTASDGSTVRIEKALPLTHPAEPAGASADADSPPGKPATSSREADQFIQEGVEATRHFDLGGATALFDRAKAFNPEQPRLWAGYGIVAMEMGKPIEAGTDFRKELALHPDELAINSALAQVELAQGHRAEAETALRNWLAGDPTAVPPALQLTDMLLADKKPAEAVAVASAAASHAEPPATDAPDPNQARLQLVLGKAQLKAGQRDAGDKTLTGLLHATQDPGLLNDAAYELADAKLDLPLDEGSERTALDKLTAETRAWTLDEAPATMAQRSSLLVAAWDTMGWILYREGKPREAYPWIAAAWLNSRHTEVRDHLAEVAAALGPAFVHSADAVVTDRSDQAVRTIPLGKAGGRNGVAEYRLLLTAVGTVPEGTVPGTESGAGAHGSSGAVSGAKVERAEPVDGKGIPGGDELLKTARLPHFLPPGSEAHLVRNGTLNCHSGVCELIFAP